MRASSCSARLGTIASSSGTVPSSSVSLTARRYESVAAMTSLPPVKLTRMPVSTGRDSSRDAARATRCDRLEQRLAIHRERLHRVELRQAREVFGVVRVQRVARGSRRDVHDRLGRLVLDRTPRRPAADARCRRASCPAARSRRRLRSAPATSRAARAPCRLRRDAARCPAPRAGSRTGSAPTCASRRRATRRRAQRRARLSRR